MPTITKPMGFARAIESATRYVEEAAKPHQIYVVAAETPPSTQGYVIPITGGEGSPIALQAVVAEPEPREEDVEVIAGAIDEVGEPVALEAPKPRKRAAPKAPDPVYYHNPYKEEPLGPEMCALHLNISKTAFYKMVAENPDLKRRACKVRDMKGMRGGIRFTRFTLDRWRKLTAKNGSLPAPLVGDRQTGRNQAPFERKNVVQPRCVVTNKAGDQCRGLAMKGGYTVCSIHAMFETGKRAANGATNPAAHDTVDNIEGEAATAV